MVLRLRQLACLLFAGAVVACSPTAVTSPATATPSPVSSPAATPSLAAPSNAAAATASPSGRTADIVGSWTRTQSCEEALAAFEAAGFPATKISEWVTQNWVPNASPRTSAFCDGAPEAIPHSHFFRADGTFGSRDENGQQVDDGDYAIASPGTLSFPSHAADFNYGGIISVRYAISGDQATFDVQVPASCLNDAGCAQAYAWAVSAFFAGPAWTRS